MGAKTDEMQKANNKVVQNNVIKGSPRGLSFIVLNTDYKMFFRLVRI
jgi:hypothetical protein